MNETGTVWPGIGTGVAASAAEDHGRRLVTSSRALADCLALGAERTVAVASVAELLAWLDGETPPRPTLGRTDPAPERGHAPWLAENARRRLDALADTARRTTVRQGTPGHEVALPARFRLAMSTTGPPCTTTAGEGCACAGRLAERARKTLEAVTGALDACLVLCPRNGPGRIVAEETAR